MGGAGFEPAKAEPADLQSAPFDRFGILPIFSNFLLINSKASEGTRTHDLLITNQLL